MSKIIMPEEFTYMDSQQYENDDGGLPKWAYITIGVVSAVALVTGGAFLGKYIAGRSAAANVKISSFSNLSKDNCISFSVNTAEQLQTDASQLCPALYGHSSGQDFYSGGRSAFGDSNLDFMLKH